MCCNEVQKLISSYFDKELTNEKKMMVEKHMATCKSCQTVYDRIKYIHKNAEILLVDPPTNLCSSIMRQVSQEATEPVKFLKSKKINFLIKLAGVAMVSIILTFFMIVWKNDKHVSADEIVFKMANTINNLESYHAEVSIENITSKDGGKEDVRKSKIIEYMKKPFYQRVETDAPVKEIRISNGDKSYYTLPGRGSVEPFVNSNPMEIPRSYIFQGLNKQEILKGINSKRLKLVGETDFNGRKAYKIEGEIIDFQNVSTSNNNPSTTEARLVMLIDKETSIPLQTTYYHKNEKKPYRRSTYAMFNLNEQIDDKLFVLPDVKSVYPGWRPVKDIESAKKMIKDKIDLPQYLPAGAKLNKIGYANGRNIRLEYLFGKNVIYITYGSLLVEGGDKRKIDGIWFNNTDENFWSSKVTVRKGISQVLIEGTISLTELTKVAESVLTTEEKEQELVREKDREKLLEKYKAALKNVKVNNEKYSGKIDSLKISSVNIGQSSMGEEKWLTTTYFKAPFYIFRDNGDELSSNITIYNKNKYLVVPYNISDGIRLSYEPMKSIAFIYQMEDGNIKMGADSRIKRKVVGSDKYINRPITIVEYTYNYDAKGWGPSVERDREKSTLYVDDQTGILLKQSDTIKGKQRDLFYVTELVVNPEISDRLFEIPENLKAETQNEHDLIALNKSYQEVSVEQLKLKANVPVKIPRYLPEYTKLLSSSLFNYSGNPGEIEALQLYSVEDQPLLIYSKKKYPGELMVYFSNLVDIGGKKYYYANRDGIQIFESEGNNNATHIESTIPLEEIKKVIASLQ